VASLTLELGCRKLEVLDEESGCQERWSRGALVPVQAGEAPSRWRRTRSSPRGFHSFRDKRVRLGGPVLKRLR
jgi:hypothetical protein